MCKIEHAEVYWCSLKHSRSVHSLGVSLATPATGAFVLSKLAATFVAYASMSSTKAVPHIQVQLQIYVSLGRALNGIGCHGNARVSTVRVFL